MSDRVRPDARIATAAGVDKFLELKGEEVFSVSPKEKYEVDKTFYFTAYLKMGLKNKAMTKTKGGYYLGLTLLAVDSSNKDLPKVPKAIEYNPEVAEAVLVGEEEKFSHLEFTFAIKPTDKSLKGQVQIWGVFVEIRENKPLYLAPGPFVHLRPDEL